MSCIFCNLPKERIILENELAYAIYDGFPVSPGHMLVIPKRHFQSYFDANHEEKLNVMELIDGAKQIIEEKNRPDGYNIGINIGETAGQSVMHLHVHIIPRYKGDVENPRGGVRGVIPHKKDC